MRRHFRFGADQTAQRFIYAITQDWSVFSPYWISMPHKLAVYENLVRGWGATFEDSVYIQNCKWVGDAYVQPHVDCLASHFTQNYRPIGSLSPLPVFLLNGFIDKDFASLPPVWIDSRILPP